MTRSRAARVGITLIRLYQAGWSSRRPPTCRYTPSCSAYAVDALTEYGFARGTWLATKRIARCHPLHPGGWDPVPVKDEPAGSVLPVKDEPVAGSGTQPRSGSSDLQTLLGRTG
ncbi:MAG TPA: membrane protein insertion efficiency factor YidD [Jatrophihabitans sp.]|nr:membrane protein insertion efficiency factor YidD [Jatrophihabitans sp.]